jgi:hypothetical protein
LHALAEDGRRRSSPASCLLQECGAAQCGVDWRASD